MEVYSNSPPMWAHDFSLFTECSGLPEMFPIEHDKNTIQGYPISQQPRWTRWFSILFC